MLIGQHLVVSYSGDIVHHVQQHFQFRFQLRHYSLQPYQKPQARQLRQPEQNIQVLPVLIYTFMELRVGISQAAIEQWGYSNTGKTGHITISLPISATQILMGLASYVDAIGAGDIGVYDISPTSIIIDVDSGKLGKTDFYWFVLGTV